MANRNPVKQLFITFPHSVCDKLTFRDHLVSRFEPSYYKVCEEKHKDGSPHLHAVIKFKNKYSKAFVLKYFKDIFPDHWKRIDIKPVRSIKNAIEYLSKEDTTPLESGAFQDGRGNTKVRLIKDYIKSFKLLGVKFTKDEELEIISNINISVPKDDITKMSESKEIK